MGFASLKLEDFEKAAERIVSIGGAVALGLPEIMAVFEAAKSSIHPGVQNEATNKLNALIASNDADRKRIRAKLEKAKTSLG